MSYSPGRFVIPPKTGWSWLNQGSATIDESGSDIILSISGDVTDNIRLRTRPMAAGKQVIAAFSGFDTSVIAGGNFPQLGLAFTDLTKVLCVGRLNDSALNLILNVNKFNTVTSFNANVSQRRAPSDVFWIKVLDDGANRKASWSTNQGITWSEFYSETNTTFLTATHYGIFVNGLGATTTLTLKSWLES